MRIWPGRGFDHHLVKPADFGQLERIMSRSSRRDTLNLHCTLYSGLSPHSKMAVRSRADEPALLAPSGQMLLNIDWLLG